MRSSAVLLREPADSDPMWKMIVDPSTLASTYPALSGSSAASTARAVASSA